MIVVTGYPNIRVTLTLRRGENRVQNRDGAPVREEVALLIVGRWILAEVELIVNPLRKFELIGG